MDNVLRLGVGFTSAEQLSKSRTSHLRQIGR
jgi:hypothetical protein